jgi:hypothetical protein
MLRPFTIAAAVGFFAAVAVANPSPPIPVPRITAEKAIALAEEAFRQSIAPVEDPAGFFVQSVEYTDQGAGGASTGEWAWHVTFLHPVRNDRSVVFRVGADGRAVLVGGTE